MPSVPIYEKISFNKQSEQVCGYCQADCKTDIYCETVKRIINVSPTVQIENAEVSQGSVSYAGRICLIICYEDTEGKILKTEHTSPFSGTQDCPAIDAEDKISLIASLEKIDADASGVKLTFSARIKVCGETSGQRVIDALVGGEEIISNGTEVSTLKSLGIKETSYPIEENFELSFGVKEIISHTADTQVTSCQCGVGCIIVDGEVYVSMLAIIDSEETSLTKIEKTIPYRAEIECEEAMPVCFSVASVRVKSYKTDVAVNKESGKTEGEISVVLGLRGEAFENKTCLLADDAFSLTEKVELEKEVCYAQSVCENRTYFEKISNRCNIEEISATDKLVATTGERAEITLITPKEGACAVTGVCSAVGWFVGDGGRIFSRKMEIPFALDLENTEGCDCNFIANVVAYGGVASVVTLTETAFECNLVITLSPRRTESVTVIKGITVKGEKQSEKSAISVYIAKSGESLWQLSKRLNSCPEKLIEANQELSFPLTGDERIIVYRQK